MADMSTDTPEFGYWPKRKSGVVERRRRPATGTWTEIDRSEAGQHSVRCQHGSGPGENEFASIGKALPLAKDPSASCDQCAQAAQLVAQAKSAKPEANQTKAEAKPKTETKPKAKPKRRRSGKANGPRISDGRKRPVKSRTDEAIKTAA
jgi:hypothetical protein